MLDDEKPATPEQERQMSAGRYMALSNAVHALIASHPAPAVFSACLDQFAQVTDPIFLHPDALQKDDGMRLAYSEVMRSIRASISTG